MKWWRSLLEASDREAERRAKEGQDKLYAALRASGADARLAPKGRPEETLGVNNPPASWGASGREFSLPSPLEFALQRLKTLLATPPAIHPRSKLRGILAGFYKRDLGL